MMKPSKLLLGLASAGALVLIATKHNARNASKRPATRPTPVERVDLTRYKGKWYEIARLPLYFQRNCASDVTATYTINGDGSIKVDNKCRTAKNTVLESIGNATKNGPSGSRLYVTFLPDSLRWLPFGQADYWVLALDDDYQYALVGTPNQKHLWFLSRTPNMPNDVYAGYVTLARQQGYDVSKLIKTPHTGE